MKYKFPHITNISQVLPVIEGLPEFVVAVKDGGYTVINYNVAFDTTFPPIETEADAIRRECRGMIFDTATGNILRRPLHKFWNINEREETQLAKIDFTDPHIVLSKLDGSMISPFKVNEKVRFGTKMGITDVSLRAEEYIKHHPEFLLFSEWAITNGITPIFEYTAPTNRIVVNYEVPQLTLIACRYMISGEYINF